MAEPIIVINSSTGSEITASGSPSTLSALSGTAAALTSGSAVVNLLADNPSLASVPVDGTGAIWVDSPSGRQFGKITAKDDSAKTITCSTNFDVTFSNLRWAIGGKRAAYTEKITKDVLADWEVRIEIPSTPPPVSDLTGADLIQLVRDSLDDSFIYPNIPRWTDNEILRALNSAMEFMCQEYRLIMEQISIQFTTGVREYSISNRVLSIENLSKSDYSKHLAHISKMSLDMNYYDWRNMTGEPFYWYWDDSKQIGLYPKPSATYDYIMDAWTLPQTEITLSGVPMIHRRHQKGIAYRAAYELASSDIGNDYRIAMATISQQKFLDIMKGVSKFKFGGRTVFTNQHYGIEKPEVKTTIP